ncbi:MAG: hypothetical protein HZB57_08495 [Gammaproteobacteria bacterium]|nr:hypothetical protein [Gammaproteobacteria bacterium]
MNITRLSNTAYTAPSYPVPSRNRERALELVTEADAGRSTRDTVGRGERVVQGEVLQRQRTAYSSTQDYLNSRMLDGSYTMEDSAADSRQRSASSQSGQALGAYLSHTREFIQPDVNRGKQVDYFI